MKNKKLSLKLIFMELIDITENQQPRLSHLFCLLCYCIHFLQIVSYHMKIDCLDYSEPKLSFFAQIIYYSNFTNFVSYFQSYILTIILIYSTFSFLYLLLLSIISLFLLKKYLKNTKAISWLVKAIVLFMNLFFWIFFIPILELFSNVLDCTSCSPFFEQNFCDSILLKLISILGLFSACFLCFLFLWVNQSHNFLEKGFLRMQASGTDFLIIFLHIILVSFYKYLKDSMPFLIELLIIFILGIWTISSIKNSTFSDQKTQSYFICFLIANLTISFGFMLKDTGSFLKEKNFFYVVMVSLVFAIKLTFKLINKTNSYLNDSQFKEFRYLGVSLDVFYSNFQNKQSQEKARFLFNGLFRNHYILCKIHNCFISRHKFKDFTSYNTFDQSRTLNSFISEILIRSLKDKDNRKSTDFEPLLLKYISFITYKSLNPIKSIYELEHVMTLNKNPSFYFSCIVKCLTKQLQISIREYESVIKKDLTEKKEIDVATFSYLHRSKSKLQKSFILIMKERKLFWEHFRDGFQGFDKMISSAEQLNKKIIAMIRFLDKEIKESKPCLLELMIPLKFRSLISCVVLNHLHEGVKFEDQFEKLLKRETSFNKNMLNSTSILEENVLLVQASFLGSEGLILEASKNEKMARFFNYTLEESKSLKQITQFMPRLIRGFHQKILNWYINKPRGSHFKEPSSFETFAIEKNGALFPVKMYVGHCFEYKNDFVFQTAIIKTKEEFQGFIFDKNGDFHGFSQSFIEAIGVSIPQEDLCFLNAFALIPILKETIEKNKAFEDVSLMKLRNINGSFYLPSNIQELIDILKAKANEEDNYNSHQSLNSSQSKGSGRKNLKRGQTSGSNKSNSHFISKFFKTALNLTTNNKSIIQKRYLENSLSSYEILKELIDKENCIKIKFNFDLVFYRHSYSQNDFVQYACFYLQKLAFVNTENGLLSKSKQNITMDVIGDPTMIENSDFPSNFIVMPELNYPEFRESRRDLTENSINRNIEDNNHNDNKLFTTECVDNLENNFKQMIENIKEENDLNIDKNQIKSIIIPVEKRNAIKTPDILYPSLSLNSSQEKSSNQEKSAQEEEKSHDSGFHSSESHDKLDKIQHELYKDKRTNKTSNEKIFDMNDKSSQSSSLTSLKKTFSIFNMMKLIQTGFPSVLYTIFASRMLEVLLIVIYCIILLVLSRQYIYFYYEPLETAVIAFSDLYNSFSMVTVIMLQMQMIQHNYSDISTSSPYYPIFITNLNDSFHNFILIIEKEREKSNEHRYQEIFKSSSINISHHFTGNFITRPFLEFLDLLTENINQVKNLDQFLDANDAEYFIENFIPFNDKIHKLLEVIWKEFDETNATILTTIQTVVILFLLFIFFMKFFEFYKLEIYYQEIVKIMNILLRTNQNEAITEVIVSEDIINMLTNKFDKFLHIDFTDSLINKKTVKAIEEDINIHRNVKHSEKDQKKKVKTARRSYMNPLSRYPRLIFSSLSYILIFCFIFFNYYYWSLVNNEIKILIDTTNFFQNIHTLPSSITLCKNLIFREKLIKNQRAIQINQKVRTEEFYYLLANFTVELQKSNILIPDFAIQAEEVIKTDKFTDLVRGNMCETLFLEGFINEIESGICQNIYNGAFTKGIMTISNEYANTMTYYKDEILPNYTNLSSIILIEQQNTIAVDIAAAFFINNALKILYEGVENYHKKEMFKQQNNLQIMLIFTTVFIGGGLLVISIWYWLYLKRKYKRVAFVLSLIPYDRLMNDEQTTFLIKKYIKD